MDISVDSGYHISILRQAIAEKLEDLYPTECNGWPENPGRVQLLISGHWLHPNTRVNEKDRRKLEAYVFEDGWEEKLPRECPELYETFARLAECAVETTYDEKWRETPEFFDMLSLVQALRGGHIQQPPERNPRGDSCKSSASLGPKLCEILDEVIRALEEPDATLQIAYEKVLDAFPCP